MKILITLKRWCHLSYSSLLNPFHVILISAVKDFDEEGYIYGDIIIINGNNYKYIGNNYMIRSNKKIIKQ